MPCAGKGLPVAYLAFEGEQHGFRKAETIVDAWKPRCISMAKCFGFDAGGSYRAGGNLKYVMMKERVGRAEAQVKNGRVSIPQSRYA